MRMILTQSNLTLLGGAEFTILKIAQKYNPIIYTAEYDKNRTYPEFRDFDIRVISKNSFSKILRYGRMAQGLDYGLSFYNLKIREDYDIINAHLGPSHWIRNKNERVMWHCHTPLRDIYDLYEFRMSKRAAYKRPIYKLGAGFVRNMDQEVVKKIELVVTNSRITLARIRKYYNRNAIVVGTGVDCKNYENDGDGKYFFYPSRFSPNKRQDYAIKAFQLFKKRVKGYKLVLCGPVSNDPFYQDYYKSVERLAEKVGDVKLSQALPQKKVIDMYSKCTAVIFAAKDEDMGLVPLEGMASGKPVIAVNEAGPTISIKDKTTGFLVNSVEEMSKRMVQVATDHSLAEKLGKKGRQVAKEEWSWDAFFKRYDAAIKRVL